MTIISSPRRSQRTGFEPRSRTRGKLGIFARPFLFSVIKVRQIGMKRGNVGTWVLHAHCSDDIRDAMGGSARTIATAIAK
jgi:uncharacterized membrane protein